MGISLSHRINNFKKSILQLLNMENEQVIEIKETKESKTKYIINRLKSFLRECLRVLQLTKKPNKEEFKIIIKVSLIGIAIIGLIGFTILLISQMIKGLI